LANWAAACSLWAASYRGSGLPENVYRTRHVLNYANYAIQWAEVGHFSDNNNNNKHFQRPLTNVTKARAAT